MKQNDARKIETHLDCQPNEASPQEPTDAREIWEKEQYACYYNYLFSLIKQERLYYEKVAKRSGLKEQRIEEALTFRLKPSRRSTQLFGYREGACYVCNGKMHAFGPMEPVCLKCLQMIEVACLEIEEDTTLLKPSSETVMQKSTEENALLPLEVPLKAQETEPTAPSEQQMVPITLLQAAQEELQHYKTHFGELPPEKRPTQIGGTQETLKATPNEEHPLKSSESGSEIVLSKPEALDVPPDETEQLLKLLELNDQELASEAAELTSLLKTVLSDNNAPLRHFGFQRSKSGKAQ